MSDFFQWLSNSSISATAFVIMVCILVSGITLMYVAAFLQGREVSFWPPKIGQKPENDKKSQSSISTQDKVVDIDYDANKIEDSDYEIVSGDDKEIIQVDKYGIKITSPGVRDRQQTAGKYIEVVGRYTINPSDQAVWLFFTTPQDGRFWPKANVCDFDDKSHIWRSTIWLSREVYSGDLVIALVGRTSQVWLQYYNRVVAK